MTETTIGREPIQLVEIRQPFCSRSYGVAPCTASGPAATRCFNTRSTCQDTANFERGTPLSLFFGSGYVAERGVSGAPYIIPALKNVSTAPVRINLAGSNPDSDGLGNRALCSITLLDHPHTDNRVDPYLSVRGGNPLTAGSFWTKWMARNKYRQNIEIVVYEGYAGQALGAMVKRTYFMQSIQGPDDGGTIVIQGKDILSRIEERKAQAPKASPGKLRGAMTAVQTSFTVQGALISEYPASGTVRIGEETLTYTSVTASGSDLIFGGLVRGTDGTTAATHNDQDAVQECLRFTNQTIYSVIQTLMTTYGGVDAAYLDYAGWVTELDNYLPLYRLTSLITTPTSVTTLVSQIQQQTLIYLWWDERDALVRIKAIRGIDALPPLISAERNIVAGSFKLEERPRERVSQVWVYYGRDKVTKNLDDPTAYKNLSLFADLTSEEEELYGEPSIKKIFANWLVTAALADSTASKIITRYVDTPSQVTFQLDAKDRSIWVGDTLRISHWLDVDEYGARRIRNWTIISAEEIVPGETIEYTAEDTTLYGRIAFVMATGAANYPGAATAPFMSCYVGDAAGLLSDGSPCGRIT